MCCVLSLVASEGGRGQSKWISGKSISLWQWHSLFFIGQLLHPHEQLFLFRRVRTNPLTANPTAAATITSAMIVCTIL